MLKRPINQIVSLLVCGALFGVFANEAAAVPDPGTFLIITLNEATGERVGNIKITITQAEADVVKVGPAKVATDAFGILYHTTHAGLYRIKAQGGDISYTYLPSGAHELVVSIPVHVPGNAVAQVEPLIPNTGILHGFVTRQHGPPVSQLTAIVIQTEGAIPFRGEQAVSSDGEFIFDPHPGTYLVELRDRKGKLVASRAGINVFSDITTFVFFDL